MIGTSKSVWGFDPRTIPGCQLWLDAADSSTVTGTTTVTEWRDKSGNARHLAVGSGTTSYSSNAIVLNSSYMFVNSPVNLTNVTVFIVSKSTGVTNQTILGAKPNTDYVYNSVDGFGFYNDPPTGRIRFYGQGNDPNQSIFFTDTSVTKLYTFQSTGTTVSGWLNGTSQSGGTLTTTRTSTAQGFAIGAEWGGTSYVNIWVTASIYEILVYNSALTTSERQQVEGYLAHKWGLVPPPPTIPLTISGCQLWLDAADTSSLTLSGSTVTQWNDKSGNGRNTSSAIGSSVRVSNAVNNLPGVYFNSTAFRGPFVYSGTQLHCFLVGTMGDSGQYPRVLSIGNGVNDDFSSPLTSIPFSRGGPGVSGIQVYRNNTGVGASFPAYNTAFLAVSAQYANTQEISVNGATPTTGTTNTSAAFSTTTYGLGIQNNITGTGEQTLVGYICELIVFNTYLTTTQRQTIEQYLSRKWGIGSSSIPSTHPFYSIRPHLRAFQPIDVPGCQLWLDAADQSSMTLSGSSVTQWNDKSGNGNTVIQATSANQPTYVTNVVNGNPVLRFNGTSHVLQTTSFTSLGTNSVSFWLVERNLSNSGGGGAPFSFNSGPNGGIVFQNNNGLQPLPNSVPYTSSVARIVFYNRTNTGSGDSGYLNGTVVSIRDDNTTGTYGTTFAVGMRILSTIYTSGDICEILIFIGMPTVSERQQVEGYLAHKWGVTPYYTNILPLTIPGCALWLDAADSSTTTSITSGIWTDKSGNSYNTSYVSGGSGFTLGTINGLSAVTFPGGSNKVITTSVPTSTSTGFSIFFIASRSSSSGTNTRYIANLTSSLQIYTVSGTNTIASYVGATFPSTSLSISTGVPFILSLTVSSSTFSQWINGIANSSTGSTVSTSGSTIVIGGSGSYTTDLVFAGQIGEVIIFNTTLSTTQRQTVEGYLAKKWGLTTLYPALPSSHPFKSFPPASLPFSPRNISGLQLWLDADDASNFTGSTWNDKSGTNNHAVNGTPGTTSMPTVTTWSNGLRAARFVKESKNSIKTTNSIPIYVTYFIVARVQDFIGATGFGLLMVNNYDGQRQLRTNSTSFPVSVFYFTQTGGTNMVLGSFSQGQEFLFSGTVTSDSAIGYSNGVQCGTSGVNPNTIPSRHYFGSGDGDAAYVSADFGEILIYDSILTTSQRQQVEGYLAHKWGLVGSLPATHPYSKFPPP
jgi:hypothetical protein